MTANLHVAVAGANRFRRSAIDPADLIQEGTIGLMRACDKFDPARGHRFGSYAGFWVRQQIARGLIEHTGTIRIPLQMAAARHRVARAERKFSLSHGRAPSRGEVSAASGLTEKVVATVGSLPPDPLSLHATLGDGESYLMSHVADATVARADETLASKLRNEMVRRALEQLPRREAAVLRMRFGLDGGEELTLREVGELFHISRERVRRVEELALTRLAPLLREVGVADSMAA